MVKCFIESAITTGHDVTCIFRIDVQCMIIDVLIPLSDFFECFSSIDGIIHPEIHVEYFIDIFRITENLLVVIPGGRCITTSFPAGTTIS